MITCEEIFDTFECPDCDGTGLCPACQDDGEPCSWCEDGCCDFCGGSGLA